MQHAEATIKGFRLQRHIDGATSIPEKFLTTDDERKGSVNTAFKNYEQQDNLLKSWLLESMDSQFKIRMVGCVWSHQIWHALKVYFASQMRARVKQLKIQLRNIKKTGSIAEYLVQVKQIVETLAAIGAPLSVEDHIDAIFDGLDEDYDGFITSWQRIQCQLCGKLGHSAYHCWSRFDENLPDPKTTQHNTTDAVIQEPLHQAMIATSATQSSLDDTWYPDTGATNHFTNDLSNLMIKTPFVGSEKVAVGNENSCFFEFHSTDCFVKSQGSRKLLLQGKLKDGLYAFENLQIVHPNNDFPISALYSSTTCNSLPIWHSRLGHCANKIVKHVLKQCNISVPLHDNATVCGSCCLPLSVEDHIDAIFDGLDEDYDGFITSCITRTEAYTVAEIEALLMHQEERLERHKQRESLTPQANIAQSQHKKVYLYGHSRLGHCANKIVKHVLKQCNISVPLHDNATVCGSCCLGKMHKSSFPISETVYTEPLQLGGSISKYKARLVARGYTQQHVVMLTANLVMHSKTKHFELDLWFVREKVAKGEINVKHVPTQFQIADLLTKAPSSNQFLTLRTKLNVHSLRTLSLRGGVRVRLI
uniref:Uncharacterized protein n=1 Tax=Cajanus cajan TaxID=3821 RepID=A0A151QZ78_CAJCA|nr:hypothetical protein KK1_043331 [Cajanus cajan]